MSVFDSIEEMKDRLAQGKSLRVSQKIQIYSEGVKAKLKQAEYALSRIVELSTAGNSSTLTDDRLSQVSDLQINDKLYFYVDSFFAFLYSTFDILSHVVNQQYNLRITEDAVSFNRTIFKLESTHPSSDLLSLLKIIRKKHFFKQLESYRNCSTHRRQIYINTSISLGTPGYTACSSAESISWIICDDPNSLNPRITKNRRLIPYSTKILEDVRWGIIEISRKV